MIRLALLALYLTRPAVIQPSSRLAPGEVDGIVLEVIFNKETIDPTGKDKLKYNHE